jgi:uridine kinase
MIGDKIHIRDEYYKLSDEIYQEIEKRGLLAKPKFTVGIAGESGSGKSVTAICLQRKLLEYGIQTLVFHIDDYFKLPPKSNHQARIKDIKNVGSHEVNLALAESHCNAFMENVSELKKPIINYHENVILEEVVSFSGIQCLILEGTYALKASDLNYRIYMSRTYKDTKIQRKNRARDEDSEFIEKILEIEQHEILLQKDLAHAQILKDYQLKIIS